MFRAQLTPAQIVGCLATLLLHTTRFGCPPFGQRLTCHIAQLLHECRAFGPVAPAVKLVIPNEPDEQQHRRTDGPGTPDTARR